MNTVVTTVNALLFIGRNIWFEAATLVAVPPPVEIPAESVLKSALAGGLACALSTSLLHPIDSMKVTLFCNLYPYVNSRGGFDATISLKILGSREGLICFSHGH